MGDLVLAISSAVCMNLQYKVLPAVWSNKDELQGEHLKAVQSLEQYIQLCPQLDNVQPDAKAFCALAECQQTLGDLQGAVQTLQAFLLKSRHQDARVCCFVCLSQFEATI